MTFRVLALSGGGTKGSFQVPILQELSKQDFDLVLGVSVGALNGSMFAQKDTDNLRNLWENIDQFHYLFGIPGYLSLAFWRNRGIYSLKPLRKKLQKLISLEKLKIPFGCGATIKETDEYITLMANDCAEDYQLHNIILGSSAISGLMEPIPAKVNDKVCNLADGGHRHVIPIIPARIVPEGRELDITVITCFPIDSYIPHKNPHGIISNIQWTIGLQMEDNSLDDLDDLRALHEMFNTRITIYAPTKSISHMLDARKDTIKAWFNHAYEVMEKPIIWS